jgi:peroxiredoxin
MNLYQLPDDLPTPKDDGACNHLTGIKFPQIELICTNERSINPGKQAGYSVIYIYPMTGQPNVSLAEGWDSIPGARGCTPQSCSFRDSHNDLKKHTTIYGLSSQNTAYQQEAKSRLQLPFELISDSDFLLKKALSLPTFIFDGIERYKRLTLIIQNNVIKKIFYPVFPPDKNAENILNWFESQS